MIMQTPASVLKCGTGEQQERQINSAPLFCYKKLLCVYKLGSTYCKITCKEQERVLGQTTLRRETVMEIDY